VNPLRKIAATLLILALAGCGGLGAMKGMTHRPLDVTQLPPMRVASINVTVPETLTVSEADGYKPKADLLWRGDPIGDRYAQIKKIMVDGLTAGARTLTGDRAVNLQVDVRRFHALTERTRYSIGGAQETEFMLTVSDAKTGEVVIPTYLVVSNFPLAGGEEALAEEHAGITEKSLIEADLARVIILELTGVDPAPAG